MPEPSPEPEARPGPCLIVEDHEEVLNLMAGTLARDGWPVLKARSSGEARGTLAMSADIALVVLDLTLPDQPGEELAIDLHRAAPELPIVITSGRATAELEAIQAVLGTVAILPKPFSLHSLCVLARELSQAR